MQSFMFLPAQAPAKTPAPGVQALSAEEVAARAGTLRNDSVGDDNYQRAPFPTVTEGSEQPDQWVPRIARPTMHPAGPTGTLRQTDWDAQGGDEGRHGALVLTSGTPDGSQEPYGQSPRTFRAQPSPWDSGVVSTGSPYDPQVIGDE
jgi:hypothetical protein